MGLIVLAVMFAVVSLFAVRQCLVSGKNEKYEKIADDKDCYVEGTGYGSIAALNRFVSFIFITMDVIEFCILLCPKICFEMQELFCVLFCYHFVFCILLKSMII